MPKLFNTVIVFDVYTVGEDPEKAREAALTFIRDQSDPLEPSTSVAVESREARNVRDAWADKKPLVAADVSDEDFEQLKGKTTLEAHALYYKKPEEEKPKSKAK